MDKLQEIKNGWESASYVTKEETEWLIEQAEKVEELISLALWSIRRLPTNYLKHNALHELKKVVGNNHKYSEFIDKCKGEVPID